MAELVRTNDVALISAVEGLLQAAEIPCFVADRHASVIDGSMQFVQMRVLVADDREDEARELLTEAELLEAQLHLGQVTPGREARPPGCATAP